MEKPYFEEDVTGRAVGRKATTDTAYAQRPDIAGFNPAMPVTLFVTFRAEPYWFLARCKTPSIEWAVELIASGLTLTYNGTDIWLNSPLENAVKILMDDESPGSEYIEALVTGECGYTIKKDGRDRFDVDERIPSHVLISSLGCLDILQPKRYSVYGDLLKGVGGNLGPSVLSCIDISGRNCRSQGLDPDGDAFWDSSDETYF